MFSIFFQVTANLPRKPAIPQVFIPIWLFQILDVVSLIRLLAKKQHNYQDTYVYIHIYVYIKIYTHICTYISTHTERDKDIDIVTYIQSIIVNTLYSIWYDTELEFTTSVNRNNREKKSITFLCSTSTH